MSPRRRSAEAKRAGGWERRGVHKKKEHQAWGLVRPIEKVQEAGRLTVGAPRGGTHTGRCRRGRVKRHPFIGDLLSGVKQMELRNTG